MNDFDKKGHLLGRKTIRHASFKFFSVAQNMSLPVKNCASGGRKEENTTKNPRGLAGRGGKKKKKT